MSPIKKIGQIIHRAPFLSFAGKYTNIQAHINYEGQIYFNKTTELQPQFHFDEFPPAGVSQAEGGRPERQERESGRWGLGSR